MTDIRAAAERLRRVNNGESVLTVYCPKEPFQVWPHYAIEVALSLKDADIGKTSAAYLELVPADDGEPVDFADYRMGPLVTLRIGICGVGRWGAFVRHGSNEEFLLREVANRGDVRRLLAALGVTP